MRLYFFSPARFRILSGLALMILILAGCKDKEPGTPQQSAIDNKLLQDHFAAQGIQAQKDPSGLYYERLRTTNGPYIQLGEVASVYYKITLLNGKVLESRQAENSQPFKFVHASGGLVPVGINEGVSLMRRGEIFRFYLTSDQAFEDFYMQGFMGPNALLVAEIELVAIETQQEHAASEIDSIRNYIKNQNWPNVQELPSGVFLCLNKKVEGGNSPGNNDTVELKLDRRYLNDEPADFYQDSPVALDLSKDITEGLRQGILHMKEGEKAIILVPSYLAFGGVFNNINGSIQIFPEKFRAKYIEEKLSAEASRQLGIIVDLQNIYPLSVLKYEVELLGIL